MNKQLAKTVFVLLPVLGGIGVAGYYLYMDYTSGAGVQQDAAHQEIIGEVAFVSQNVKRKLGDGVMWEPIDKKASLFAKDSIRTGSDSYATIRFNDGNLLEVNENSLIVLDKTTDKLSIDFKVGDIASRGDAKGLEIKVNDSIIQSDGADLKLKTGSDKKTDVVVEKGNATITGKDKKKTALSTAKKAAVDEKGNADIIQVPVLLKSPEDRASIKSSLAEVKHTFTWEVLQKELTQERFEISRSDKFVSHSTRVFQAHQSMTVGLKQGMHYWRVGWPVGKGFEYSDVRRVAVEADKRLELTFPENETQFQLDPSDDKVEFSWASQFKNAQYILEVAQSPDFKALFLTKNLKEALSREKGFQTGNYYWRVRALDEKNNVLAESTTFSFAVKLKLPLLPALQTPAADAVLTQDGAVGFTWSPLEKTAMYRILVTRDREQKLIAKADSKAETRVTWKPVEKGGYFWSVAALNSENHEIGQSEVRAFTYLPETKTPHIFLINPKNKTEIVREKKAQMEPVVFQWKAGRKMPGPFTFLISKDPGMKQAQKKEGIKHTSFPLRLSESATYYWKVTSQTQTRPQVQTTSSSPTPVPQTPNASPPPLPQLQEFEYSEISEFIYKINSNLAPPLLQEPLNKAEVVIVEPQPVQFTWKPVEGAAQYRVLVERFDPQTKEHVPVMDRLIKETTLKSQPLQEGEYSWSIASVDDKGQVGLQSKPRTFTVNLQEELGAPQLKAPVVK